MEEPSNAVLNERLNGFCETLTRIEEKLDKDFVTQHEFRPVKAIAFGALGFIGLAVLAAIVASVIIKAS